MSLRRSPLHALFATVFGAPLASAASVPAVVVGLVAAPSAAGCRRRDQPIDLAVVAHANDSLRLYVSIDTKNPTRTVVIRSKSGGFTEEYRGLPATAEVSFPWHDLPREPDGSVVLTLVATNDVDSRTTEVKVVPPPEAHPGPKPGAGGSGGAPYPTGSVTLELAPYHGTQPVWTVDGDLARDLEAQAKAQNRIFYPPQLAGDPIELRFGVPQGAALSFGGQPLPVVNGIAVLRRSQSELLLGLEPKDLLIRGRTYATQVRLPFTVQRGESRVPLEVRLTAARYTPSLAPLIDSVAAGSPISHDGARSGGFFEYEGSVGKYPAVVDLRGPLRTAAFVGKVAYEPVPSAPTKTCPYSSGYKELYFARAATLTVFDAATAKKVGARRLVGDVGGACPTFTTSYGSAKSRDVVEGPSEDALTAAFRTLAKLPAPPK
jgi:hypothetical protein